MTFTDYLKAEGLSRATATTYEGYLGEFTAWLAEESIQGKDFSYGDMLDFMGQMKTDGRSNATVRHLLCVMRHYCNYLIGEGQRGDNPAAGIYVRGLIRRLPANLLSMEEMEQLCHQYTIQLNVDDSKKILFFLLVYQGLTTGELMRLESRDIKLQEGKIRIKGTGHSNERLLNLNASQVPRLQTYLKQNKSKSGPLFIEQRRAQLSELNINNRIQYMFKQLKVLNERVINAKQIRSSVITYWLQNNHLRQVQYMAGLKYVSSTERYQLNHLEDLQSEVKRHHPMQ
jgi:site-specific recombinase XerD